MSIRKMLAIVLVVFALSAGNANAEIVITFTPQGGPVAVDGAMNGVGLNFLQSVTVVVKDGTVAEATNAISDLDILSVTVQLDSQDYTYDRRPITFSDRPGSEGLSDNNEWAYFVPRAGGQNIQIADGASVSTLNGTTVRINEYNTASSRVGFINTTFNGGADRLTNHSFVRAPIGGATFDVSVVPEPTSFAMFGIAMFGMARRRRKP